MACRIVICDDYDAYRFTLHAILETDARFEVVGEAANGLEAIQRCAELQPDVVVLDIAMPEMDGLTALPTIREQCPDARIVMHSAFAERAVAENAASLGADGYLEKGSDLERIIATIADACAGTLTPIPEGLQ
ncbi:MAG: two-component response regulator [Thermoleophilia bacterium]|nr:two-component response regulator [Thermoleophilia bacterium]